MFFRGALTEVSKMLETQGSNISNMHTQSWSRESGWDMWCVWTIICHFIILCLFNSLRNYARQLSEECKSLWWTTKAYIFSLLLNVQLELLLFNLCIKYPSVAWPHRPLVIELLVPELRVAESKESKTLRGTQTQVFWVCSLALMFYLNKIW